MSLHTYEGYIEVPFRTALPHGDTYGEFELEATYTYTPPFKGLRDEPAHGGELDIISVRFRRTSGTVWRTLPRRAFDYVALADRIYDEHDSMDDGYADYLYETRRDERMEARHG